MGKEAKNTPINTTWAEETPNVVAQTDNDRRKGIEFQSLIVSNQLNSAFKTISDAMRFHQCNGGQWLQNFNYSVGNVVAVIVTLPERDGLFECQYFRCKADNVNVFPYVSYSPTTQNGVSVYRVSSAAVQPQWELCNGLEKWVDKTIDDKTSDKWKNLGSVAGTFNLDFSGANNNFNNFSLSLSGSTRFQTCNFMGAKERSGLLVITSGGNYLSAFFSNAYYSFGVPFDPLPNNSGEGNKLVFPFKIVPNGAEAGVYFTRI